MTKKEYDFEMLDPITTAESARRNLSAVLGPIQRSKLGQFFTPPSTARLMASMSELRRERMRLLDAGAGVGALTAAWVSEICSRAIRPKEVVLTAYEVDENLISALRYTLTSCEKTCSAAGIACKWEIRTADFIEAIVGELDAGLFQNEPPVFDVAILNPPLQKIPYRIADAPILAPA